MLTSSVQVIRGHGDLGRPITLADGVAPTNHCATHAFIYFKIKPRRSRALRGLTITNHH